MVFIVNAGSENRLETAIAEYSISAAKKVKADTKVCDIDGCDVAGNWQKFKKDPTYDHYMRGHRIRGGKMEAKSPPGYGGTVEHMKKSHPEIGNPSALAWYMYEKGDKSHVKAPKGSGAKYVSKEVQKKRSKALKAGGPGSGRHAGESASTKAEHLAAADYHAKLGAAFLEKPHGGEMVAMEHFKAETAHRNAARLDTTRHTTWAQQASGSANATQDNYTRDHGIKVNAPAPVIKKDGIAAQANVKKPLKPSDEESRVYSVDSKRKKKMKSMKYTTTKLPNDMMEES